MDLRKHTDTEQSKTATLEPCEVVLWDNECGILAAGFGMVSYTGTIEFPKQTQALELSQPTVYNSTTMPGNAEIVALLSPLKSLHSLHSWVLINCGLFCCKHEFVKLLQKRHAWFLVGVIFLFLFFKGIKTCFFPLKANLARNTNSCLYTSTEAAGQVWGRPRLHSENLYKTHTHQKPQKQIHGDKEEDLKISVRRVTVTMYVCALTPGVLVQK